MAVYSAVERGGAGTAGGDLDYYLIMHHGGMRPGRVDAIVVEEFVNADDYSTIGLNTAVWTPGDARWTSSTDLGRRIRTEPSLRVRTVPADRDEAAEVYGGHGGGALPDEATLRGHFDACQPLAVSAPLRLDTAAVPEGFHDRRVYRLLLANELSADDLASVRALWRMAPADPATRVLGTARRRVAQDVFTWDLRRIGPGTAWCVDLTAYLRGRSVDAVGRLLVELKTVMRGHGLIPVAIERFS